MIEYTRDGGAVFYHHLVMKLKHKQAGFGEYDQAAIPA